MIKRRIVHSLTPVRLLGIALLSVQSNSLLQAADLTVAAASDLAPLEGALKKAWGGGLRFSFGSSGALLRQIENGAPFDVYLSANEQYVDEGIRKGILVGPARLYSTGRVALWSRGGSVRSLLELREAKILHVAIANPAYAPYGVAAKHALEEAGLWKAVESKIVYGENVRQALQYAESGNADAAIVAWSMVFDRGGIILPGAAVRQSGAVVKATGQPVEARRFLDWLLSPSGQSLFEFRGRSTQPPNSGRR